MGSFVMEQDVTNICTCILVADINSLCIFWFFTSDMTQAVDLCVYM